VHELSICQALLIQLAEIARDRGAEAIERIVLEVGPLSGVDASLLARAFEVACLRSCAAQATLSIDRLLCGACGGYRTRIVAGDELQLRRVELRMPGSRTAPDRAAQAGV